MVPYAKFIIPAATIQGLAGNTAYWVDRNGNTLQQGGTNVPNESYDFDTSEVIRIYIAHGAQTGGTGMVLRVRELWPITPLPTAPAFAAVGDTAIEYAGPAITTGAEVLIFNLSQYVAYSAASGGTPTNTIYRGGRCGIIIAATTWPTTAADWTVAIMGLRGPTFPRH